jgi:hypothetical protein
VANDEVGYGSRGILDKLGRRKRGCACAKARLFRVSERECGVVAIFSEAIDIVKREAGDVAEV